MDGVGGDVDGSHNRCLTATLASYIVKVMTKKKLQKDNKPIEYDTKVKYVEKRYGIKLSDKKETTMGDFFRERGYPAFAELLQMKKV
mgnify:CR=1 FL=1